MNYSQSLYAQLDQLVKTSTTYFFKDVQLPQGQVMRIFNYRLASWTEFQQGGALDARGTMFDITVPTNPRLVCLPPQKFFNYGEGTIDHSAATVGIIMDKRDGSLISTYTDDTGQLRLKSKGALWSDQAVAATKWLDGEPEFKSWLTMMDASGHTVNMEWTSPLNRIVVAYATQELRVLNLRNRNTGATTCPKWIHGVDRQRLVDYTEQVITAPEVYERALVLTEGEGYVVEMLVDNHTYYVKCKSLHYLMLHKLKDNITNPRALYELVLNDGSDDIRELLASDEVAMSMVRLMEAHVFPIYNGICDKLEQWHAAHAHLDRKSYAIKCKAEHPTIMHLFMMKYVGNEYDVKQFMIKNFDMYSPADLLATAGA